VTSLHADRIGHGYHLFSADLVYDPKNGGHGAAADDTEHKKQRETYVNLSYYYIHPFIHPLYTFIAIFTPSTMYIRYTLYTPHHICT
jgi:hypothetical protein